MSIISTALVVFILADIVWCWKACLSTRPFHHSWRIAANAGIVAFTVLQLGEFLLLIFNRDLDIPIERFLPKPAIGAVYVWHCLVLMPAIVLWFLGRFIAGISWIGRRLYRLLKREPDGPASGPVATSEGQMTRRDFVTAALSAAPAVVTVGITGIAAWQWNQFRIRRLTISLPNLPARLDGLTIAQVNDLHVGVFTHGAILDEIVEASNRLQPDLVLLPGDLINYSLRDLPAGLDTVKRLQARFGVFMCEGNHDLFEDADAFRAQTAAAGVRLLVNDTAIVPVRDVPVQVLGLRWGWGDNDPRASSNRGDPAIARSMKELLPKRKADAFPILLAHHPHAFDYAGDIPLTLTGHTHGGQLMLTKQIGFGPAMFRYWTGLYEKAGRALVVSNGVGNWFPLRVQAPAEIVHITLRAV